MPTIHLLFWWVMGALYLIVMRQSLESNLLWCLNWHSQALLRSAVRRARHDYPPNVAGLNSVGRYDYLSSQALMNIHRYPWISIWIRLDLEWTWSPLDLVIKKYQKTQPCGGAMAMDSWNLLTARRCKSWTALTWWPHEHSLIKEQQRRVKNHGFGEGLSQAWASQVWWECPMKQKSSWKVKFAWGCSNLNVHLVGHSSRCPAKPGEAPRARVMFGELHPVLQMWAPNVVRSWSYHSQANLLTPAAVADLAIYLAAWRFRHVWHLTL